MNSICTRKIKVRLWESRGERMENVEEERIQTKFIECVLDKIWSVPVAIDFWEPFTDSAGRNDIVFYSTSTRRFQKGGEFVCY